MKKTCMIFSPHQDDACLVCGGIIYQKIKNENVVIVDIANGRNIFWSLYGIKKDPTPEETERLRNKEDIAAMGYLGVPKENMFFLGFEDILIYKSKIQAEKKIFNIIKKFQPSEVYIPSGIDIHPDHVIANEIIIKCLRELKFEKPVYEYFIWSRPKIEKRPPKDLIKIDISKELRRKKTALQLYKSQVSIFLPNQKKPVLEESFLKYFTINEEIFRKINIYRQPNKLKHLLRMLRVRITSIIWMRFKI